MGPEERHLSSSSSDTPCWHDRPSIRTAYKQRQRVSSSPLRLQTLPRPRVWKDDDARTKESLDGVASDDGQKSRRHRNRRLDIDRPQDWGRLRHTDDHPDPPAGNGQESHDSSNNSSSRALILAILLVVAILIVRGVASGSETMHQSNQKRTHPNGFFGSDGPGSQEYHSLVQGATATEHAFSFSSSNANVADNAPTYDNRSVSSNNGDGEAIPSHNTAGTTATILSRASQLSGMISHLDASDVVECYVVTRMAHLTNAASGLSGEGVGYVGGNGNRRVPRILDESLASAYAADALKSKAEETAATSSSSATNNIIPSGPVLIRKSALAFRYHHRVASASHNPHYSFEFSSSVPSDDLSPADQLEQQKYFELTLEYGPQRTGVTKTSESMPVVHVDMELAAETENNKIGKYVSWENEGRVYHSTRISSEWTEAYYMASITGVVLEKIIQRAVEYTYKRPRYQPFEVVSIPSRNLILGSSGSDDFVWDMFRDLADLYVDIDPLLVPPRGRVQFYVADPDGKGEGEGEGEGEGGEREYGRRGIGSVVGSVSTSRGNSNFRRKRKQPNPNVKQVKGPLEGSRAAAFYENFFNCANAIKTGDYSIYLPPPSFVPTSSPMMSTVPSIMPSAVNNTSTVEDSINYEVSDAEEHEDYDPDNDNLATLETNDDDNHGKTYVTEETGGKFHDHPNGTAPLGRRHLPVREDLLQNQKEMHEEHNGTVDETALDTEETYQEAATVSEGDDGASGPSLDNELSTESSPDVEDAEDREDDPAEAAEKAAIEAAKAAESAAAAVVATNNSSVPDTSEVLAATSEAAKAAKKAKDASVAARSKISAEALLSGDGELMTSVLSNCFSQTKYGIRKQEEIRHDADHTEGNEVGNEEGSRHIAERRDSTFAYIYLDGDVFIRLNLTTPYLGTVSSPETVPPPHVPPEGKGDMVDWAIFLLILVGTLFGFLVMVHQVGIVVDNRLRFRNFFHPTMAEPEWASDVEGVMEREEQSPLRGGGFPHSKLRMTVESIPASMGGEDGTAPSMLDFDHPDSTSLVQNDDSGRGLDLEMVERHPSILHAEKNPTTPLTSCPIKMTFADERMPSNELPVSLKMKRDTPDLVARPSSKSYSKIALPRESPKSEEGNSRKVDYNKNHAALSLPLHNP